MNLKGLPEGVEAVEVKILDRGDYYYEYGRIGQHGANNFYGGGATLVVKALPGWKFAFDPAYASYKAVYLLAAPKLFLALFEITNEQDETNVRQYYERISSPLVRFGQAVRYDDAHNGAPSYAFIPEGE